ncbi:MAG: HIT family protein [Actinomycetota bacterium]
MSYCIFCAIVAGEAPSSIVYEDEHAIAFMDINPATEGHALVIPRTHVADLWEIAEDEARHVMAVALRVATKIRAALSPDGLNIMHATGVVAFQSVFHFHLHVIPRYRTDAIRMPFVPRPGDRSKIAEIAGRIRDAT